MEHERSHSFEYLTHTPQGVKTARTSIRFYKSEICQKRITMFLVNRRIIDFCTILFQGAPLQFNLPIDSLY